MSKKPPPRIVLKDGHNDGGGCGFCLLNLSLMLTAPAVLVALIVKARRSS